MRRWTRWIVALAVVGLIVAWQVRAGIQPATVEAATAREGPLVADWSAVGYVEALTADVTSPQVGRVERVAVREGDVVRSGQVLAELETSTTRAGVVGAAAARDASEARDRAARALLAEFDAAQRERERRAAAEVAACSERVAQAVEALRSEEKAAPARVDAARAEVEAARAALRDAEKGGRPDELAQAAAEIAAAEATVARVRIDLERARELNAQGAASRRDVDAAQEALALAEAALDVRRKAGALLRQGAREDAVAAARARVRAAEAQATVAEGLQANVAAQRHRVAEARAALRSAQAALAEARSGKLRAVAMREDVAAARAGAGQSRATLEQSRTLDAERRVAAPFDGLVGRRYIDPGDMASPTAPLFTIVDPERLWISAEVDEQDLAPVRIGQPVTVTASAYAGKEIAGRVARIGGTAVPQTEIRTGARIVRVRVEVNAREDRVLLKPGMEVHVAGSATLAPRAVLAPSDAVVEDDAGAFVWLVADGSARQRKVRLGRIVGRETEIRSGLAAGDRVAVSGKETLKDGLKVRPVAAAVSR